MNGRSRFRRAAALQARWDQEARWQGIERRYTAHDVLRLRGSLRIEHSIARAGADRLWHLLQTEPIIRTFGALTGAQAVQMVKAGLKALYLSGWQVAADANLSGQTYPDQGLYPSNSVPSAIKRINNALTRADQIATINGETGRNWFAPIVADAEAGFGGPIHGFELMKAMIEAGAAGVHFEDQLASEKKCGHMGGKVLVPTSQFIRTLTAARLAADVMDVPTMIMARTDARDARLLMSDADERDHRFLTGERTPEGYHGVRGGMKAATERSLAYAPYADLLWFETSRPDLEEAAAFAETIHARFPGKLKLTFPHPSGSTVMVQLWLLPRTLRWAFLTSPPVMVKAWSRILRNPALTFSLKARSNVKRFASPPPPCSAGTFAKLAVRVFAGVTGPPSVVRMVPVAKLSVSSIVAPLAL